MKLDSSIEMIDLENYKKVNLHIYQRLVRKLIYFLYGIRLDIIFVVRKLSIYNVNLRKVYLWTAKGIVR